MRTPVKATQRDREVLKLIVDTLRANADRLRGYRVVLFGSRTRGTDKSRSDFDVGVIGTSPLPLSDFYAIEDMLDSLATLYSIEWVDLARANASFRQQAMKDARVIYE